MAAKLRWAVYQDPNDAQITVRSVHRGFWDFVIFHNVREPQQFFALYVDMRDMRGMRILYVFKDGKEIESHIPQQPPEEFAFPTLDAADRACNEKYWQMREDGK